jgi:signal transduction histidine kinase
MASAAVDRALRGEAERFSTFYRRRRDAWWFYVQADGKVFSRGEDGRALRVIGTYRDVTEPVRQEEGRHAREASTRHAQFRAALTEFASSLAHELNQPLAALSTNVQAALRLLEDGRRGPREVIAALGRSVVLAERAADVVRVMRQLVRPEGRAEKEFDLRALVREVCDVLAPEARRADVSLRVVPASGSVVVTADPGQIELVLLNLVRNAIEAIASAGSPRRVVTVRTRRLPGTVRLEVEDTGPGVAAALHERVFDAYFTTKEGGTGLGLRLCRTFAEAHGGRLVCSPARPRRGALFILDLPAGGDGPAQRVPGSVGRARAPRG